MVVCLPRRLLGRELRRRRVGKDARWWLPQVAEVILEAQKRIVRMAGQLASVGHLLRSYAEVLGVVNRVPIRQHASLSLKKLVCALVCLLKAILIFRVGVVLAAGLRARPAIAVALARGVRLNISRLCHLVFDLRPILFHLL